MPGKNSQPQVPKMYLRCYMIIKTLEKTCILSLTFQMKDPVDCGMARACDLNDSHSIVASGLLFDNHFVVLLLWLHVAIS